VSAPNFEGIDMHGIEPLPSGRFRVRFIRKGRSVSEIVATIEDAVKLRNALRDDLNSGDVVPLEGLSAAVWGKTWLRDFRSSNRGFKSERGRFNLHIAPAEWARKPLQAVESPDIISWFQKLQKTPATRNGKRQKRTLSFQTRRHLRNLGNALFADAVGMGLCKTNPFIGIKMKKTSTDRLIERVPEDWPLRPAEQRSVIEILKDDSERWIILFAMGTGLRQGELWNLHVADVHLDVPEGPWVNVRFGSKGKPPKNGRPRKVPLFGMALEAAREWLRVLPTYAPVNPEGLFCPTPAKEKEKKSGGRGRSPWVPSSGSDANAATASSPETCATRLPGTQFFRPAPGADPAKTPPLVLLLVGETPTWGIHRQAFHRALDLIAKTGSLLPRAGSVSIVGPTFSGSTPSLRNAILSWGHPPGTNFHFDIVTGSATSPWNAPAYRGDRDITYREVPVLDDVLQQTFYQYLEDQLGVTSAKDGSLERVALLTESGTAYGAAAARTTGLHPEHLVRFPLHMASVRAEYQQAQRAGGGTSSSSIGFLQPTTLDPKFDDPTQRLDTLPLLSPSTTASQDLILSREIDAFSEQGVRFVGVAATDPADVVFVTQHIRQRRPDVRIFILDADILYTHPAVVAATRGALLVTPYPLTPSLVEWSFPLRRASGDSALSPEVLSSTASEGIRRATLTLLGSAAVQSAPMAVWISAIGSNGSWPVDVRYVGEKPALGDGTSSKSAPLPTPMPAGRTAFVLAVLGFCVWQVAGIVATRWPAPLLPYRCFALLGTHSMARTCLAAFAVGVIDAIAVPLAWLYRSFQLGGYALYELGFVQRAASVVGLLAVMLGSTLVLPRILRKRPAGPAWTLAAPLISWAVPAVGLARCIHEIVREQSADESHVVLLLLRTVAVGSSLSPLAPLFLLAGIAYLFAWLHLERIRVRGAWHAASTRTRWKAGAVVLTALLTIGLLVVLFESKPLSTLEGSLGDRVFAVLFSVAAAAVSTTFTWLVLLWMDLHRHLKDIGHRFGAQPIEDAMRRLPESLAAGTATRFAPIPEEREGARTLLALAVWLRANRSSIEGWPRASRLSPAAPNESIEKLSSRAFARFDRSRAKPEPEDPSARARAALVATFYLAAGILPLLRKFFREPQNRWPTAKDEGDAAVWLDKAAELVAGHLAIRIHPIVAQIRALLGLAVGGTLLWAFALGSYVFEPERLLTTLASLSLAVILLTTLVMFIELERNSVISALSKTKPEITWHTFLTDTVTWIVLPFLAFLAVQYPAAANQVLSWVQPVAQVVQ
jgi:integrase